MKWRVQLEGGETQHCTLSPQISEGVPFTAEVAGKQVQCVWRGQHLLLLQDLGDGLYLEEVLTVLGKKVTQAHHGRCATEVFYAGHAGSVYCSRAEVSLDAVTMPTQAAADFQDEIVSPLTGKVIKVLVQQGATVQKGDALLIIEAMKMENVVHAEAQGVVATLNVKVGAAISSGDILLSLRSES